MASSLVVIKRRELFFTNLMLLGFDIRAVKEKHNVTFHKDMFCLPNKKGFEIVTFFLFTELNKVVDQDYSIVWPLVDKEQERLFKELCFTYLINIAQISNVRFPRIVQSIFSSPGGDRFYKLYLAFSSYVLEQSIRKNANVRIIERPSSNAQNFEDTSETLKLATIISVAKFQETQAVSLKHHRHWQKCAGDIIAYYRNVKKALASKEVFLQESTNLLSSLYPDENVNSSKSQDICDILPKALAHEKKVKLFWKRIEEFLDKEKSLWNIFRTELEEEDRKCMLDGSKYMVSVPKRILEECSSELEKMEFQPLEENNELSVINFIKLWTVCLEYFINCFKKAGSLKSHELSAEEKDISNIEEYLELAKSLSKKLSNEIIPDMVGRTKIFKEKIFSDSLEVDSDDIYSKFPPLSPKISFSPKSVQSRCQLPESGQLLVSPLPAKKLFLDTNSCFDPLLSQISHEAENCFRQPEFSYSLQSSEEKHSDLPPDLRDEARFQLHSFNNLSSVHKQPVNPAVDDDTFGENKFGSNEISSISIGDDTFDGIFLPSSCSKRPLKQNDALFTTENNSNPGLGPSKFRMRDSWLEEDNLTSLTIPSTPIFE